MDHINRKVLFAELLLLSFMLYIGWILRIRSLYYVMQISEFLFLMAVLKIVLMMELSVNTLLAVACSMLFNNVIMHFLHLDTPAFLYIVPFIFLFSLELLVLVRGIHRIKKGYGTVVGYAVLCCWAVLCIYRQWERFILDYYLAREGTFGFVVKVLYLLTCIVIVTVPVFLMLHWLNSFIKKWLIKLREYSMIYTEIDRSILLVNILTLGTLSIRELVSILIPFLPMENEIHLIPFWPAESTYEISLLWIGFSIMMVLIQIIYLRLLVKSISVKEELRLQEKDMHRLKAYNHALEKNMEDMKGIRHDIKNMFLTMGGFVDRSNDKEMKVFYEENIVPFAQQELQKNDLYVKLACIHGESLKSFLYFKMMQGIEQNVPVDLLVQPMNTNDIFCIGQIDLIRILGILIDNAVEEAKTCEGTVVISMKETDSEYLFSVSNTVRQQKREKGIIAGTTDKGLGRGNGLLIVDKLVQKYRNVLLNSFFKEDKFVQCLRIEKWPHKTTSLFSANYKNTVRF